MIGRDQVPAMTQPCRLKADELIAYQDGTLTAGRREIVEAHLSACDHCQQRMADFRDVDRIVQESAIPPTMPDQWRAELLTRLHQESRCHPVSRYLTFPLRLPGFIPVKLLVVVLLVLATLPTMTEAGFPLGDFVHFGKIEVTATLPPDQVHAIHHVRPSDPDASPPSFDVVAPAKLPLGLVRVEQSTPKLDHVELLYRDQFDTALLITQLPAESGKVTLEHADTRVETVHGTPVVINLSIRPDAVSALTWERDGVFFNVLVIEAPMGEYGGFKRAGALIVVEAMMDAQDAPAD